MPSYWCACHSSHGIPAAQFQNSNGTQQGELESTHYFGWTSNGQLIGRAQKVVSCWLRRRAGGYKAGVYNTQKNEEEKKKHGWPVPTTLKALSRLLSCRVGSKCNKKSTLLWARFHTPDPHVNCWVPFLQWPGTAADPLPACNCWPHRVNLPHKCHCSGLHNTKNNSNWFHGSLPSYCACQRH